MRSTNSFKPIIGITCSTSIHDTHAKQPQDRLNRAYSYAVTKAGGIPVILPNIHDESNASQLLGRIDGLLVSGGADCSPRLYAEEKLNETVEVDDIRDSYELDLLRIALERPIPILAICRGVQILNVAMGGSLWQDLPAQLPSQLCHRQREARGIGTHKASILPDSLLFRSIAATEITVNSFHHQALKEIATGLKVAALASDGVVEAVEFVDDVGGRFLVGVQYHPEEMVNDYEHASKLFQAFVSACSA